MSQDAERPEVAQISGSPGPGRGPDGSPRAIAISNPLLTDRAAPGELRQAILAAAPGVKLVSISSEGRADGSLDEVEVLLRGWQLAPEPLDRIVGRAPQLRWIHSVSVGIEHVVTPLVVERGITVTNGRGVFSRPIAEYVMTMILAVAHRLPQLLDLQRERTWQPLQATELSQLTIGLVGVGSIGREVAELARPFGPQIVAIRRRAEDQPPAAGEVEVLGGPESLPELLARSDFVVLALPLTRETHNIIDAAALAAIRPGAWLINIARGALVDEHALVRALRDGALGGAILDAFREEPLPERSPLYRLANCIVTPHTSWSSGLVARRGVDLFCDNLGRYRRGEPLRYVVDPSAGY